jgi:hypothetical protein
VGSISAALAHLADGLAERHGRRGEEGGGVLQVEAADHGRAEGFAEARHAVEAHQLAVLVAQEDLRQVGRLGELAFRRLDADVVALAVAGLVVELGDVDAAGQHVDGQRHVLRG